MLGEFQRQQNARQSLEMLDMANPTDVVSRSEWPEFASLCPFAGGR